MVWEVLLVAAYIVRRMIYMVILLVLLSIVSFVIIELPPGDYLTTMVNRLRDLGVTVDRAYLEAYEERYGLNLPLHERYLRWFGNLLQGDLGESFIYDEPVADLIRERVVLSAIITLGTLLVTYIIAIPIGVYSATHQ